MISNRVERPSANADDAMRELTVDELESVCGGSGTTLPPGDCGNNCHKCGCGCP
jgi:hypothetical protein